MKVIRFFASLLMVLAALAGCGNLFPVISSSSQIVGTWQVSVGGHSFSMTLTAGMTFTQAYDLGTGLNTYTGTYTNDAVSIVFTTTAIDGFPVVPSQVANANYSLNPNGNSMVLTYMSGPALPVLVLSRV
jgi:hypothetical protein